MSFRGRAFGLNVQSDFRVDGLPARSWVSTHPLLIIEAAGDDAVDEQWRLAADHDQLTERFDAELEGLVVERADAGLKLDWEGVGQFALLTDGRMVCSQRPGREPDWQRFMASQLLPLASVMAGREAFHASAVDVGGEVVAIVGASGAGKSTTASQLIAGNGRLVTDDVLTVTLARRDVRVYSGLAQLRLTTEAAGQDPLSKSTVVDASGKVALDLPDDQDPPDDLPLRRMYFLDRSARYTEISVGEPVPFTGLLSATFNLLLQDQARLERQMDILAVVSHMGISRHARFPSRCAPREIAAALLADAFEGSV